MEVKAGMILCDLIVLSWNQLEATKVCLDTLFKTTRIPSRLILVDNGSTLDHFLHRTLKVSIGNPKYTRFAMRRQSFFVVIPIINTQIQIVSSTAFVCFAERQMISRMAESAQRL